MRSRSLNMGFTLSPSSSSSIFFPSPTRKRDVFCLARHRKKKSNGIRMQSASSTSQVSAPSRTQKIMENISTVSEAGGAGGASSYHALKRLDQLWLEIRTQKSDASAPAEVVKCLSGSYLQTGSKPRMLQFDVIICGGTLGIFVATALSLKGLRVCIIEKNILKGRTQEWNISRKELRELVKVGILSEDEIDEVIAVTFNPNRCGFVGRSEVWVEDILNLGVSPVKLIDTVKQRFLKLGGMICEGHSVSSILTYQDAVVVKLDNGEDLDAQLIIDSMGNFSPIVRQIRSGKKPDGICLVVGSCARGFKENSTSDIIYSNLPIRKVGESRVQYFWEAFPAASGPRDRTTYLFSYMNAQPNCPSLEQMLEDYWDLMPDYQGVRLDDLEILRVVFGIFPTYRDSPLPAAFDRILQVGDASGIQSPISFGGFGSISRHLGRLSTGIHEAISSNSVDSYSLSLINPYMVEYFSIPEAKIFQLKSTTSYWLIFLNQFEPRCIIVQSNGRSPFQPNLSAAWLFQKAMSGQSSENVSPDFINELLSINFQCMKRLKDPVLRPFLQDVIQFEPLAKTLGLIMLTRPGILPSIFSQVGFLMVLEWMAHFASLGSYTFLSVFVSPFLRPWVKNLPEKEKYKWNRYLEAWEYGSGLDYKP